MIVSEIRITRAETTEYQSQKIKLRLLWEVNGQIGAGYIGEYTAVLLDGDTEFATYNFTDDIGLQDATVQFEGVKTDTKYRLLLRVPDGQGAGQSQKIDVINMIFEGVSGSYNGTVAQIYWNYADIRVQKGNCELDFSNGNYSSVVFDSSSGTLCLGQEAFAPMKEGEYVNVTLKRTDGEIVSVGLGSEVLRFYASGAEIHSGNLTAVAKGEELSLCIQSRHSDLTDGRLSFFYKDKRMWEVDEVKLEPVANLEGGYTCKVTIPSEALDFTILKKCRVRLAVKYGKSETAIAGTADTLELQTPDILIQHVVSGGLTCHMEMPEINRLPYAFELKSDSASRTVGYSDFLCETSVVGQAGQLCACAKYRIGTVEQMGPYSEKILLLAPGYYPVKDETGNLNLQYCMEQTTAGENFVILPAKLTAGFEGDISKDPIHLLKTDAGYKLSVQTAQVCTPDILEQFLLLLEGKLIPYAVYTIRNIVLRMASVSVADTAELLCGWKKELRRSYICPGMALKVAAASYMGQYTSQVQTASGFVNASAIYYPVTIDMNDSCLTFDCFISGMAQNMTISTSAAVDTQLKFISGIQDLSTGNARQPYYSILYPTELKSAETPESAYAADHVLLLASDSYSDLKQKLELLDDNPAMINSLQILKFMVLGRSALSLCIQVYCNSEVRYVPVGTTLGNVLEGIGIHSVDAVRMYRNDAAGIYREIFLNILDGTEGIVLISGDRIVCES
ncbi:MAG: hypothetical protein PHY47_13415 [Lachnospiraceae bacterium]|nr:hypothetical protein [Lachnospiraceae bacterium]